MYPTLDVNDTNTNPFLFPALSQVIPDLRVGPLNPDKPDFVFPDYESREIGVSLKQVGEVLSSLTAVEEQVGRDARHVDRLYLLVTGIMIPDGYGVKVIEHDSSGKWMPKGRHSTQYNGVEKWVRPLPYQFSYLGYRKWLNSLDLYGITTIEVPTREAQVSALQALYESHQTPSEEHETLRRVIRPKLNLPDEASPFVKSLMGLCGPDGRTFIGQATAEAIASEVPNLTALVNRLEFESSHSMSGAQTVAGITLASGRRIGPAMAAKIKAALG